jgi:hypothetical protein
MPYEPNYRVSMKDELVVRKESMILCSIEHRFDNQTMSHRPGRPPVRQGFPTPELRSLPAVRADPPTRSAP